MDLKNKLKTMCALDKVPPVKICRVCLVQNKKMVDIDKYGLQRCFKQVTGIKLSNQERLPHWLCLECAQCIVNFYQFRHKSVRANILLVKLIKLEGVISYENIQAIDRKEYKLESRLGVKHLGTDHYDFLYTEFDDVKHEDSDDGQDVMDTVEYLEDINDDVEYLEDIKDDKDVDEDEVIDEQETGYLEIEDTAENNFLSQETAFETIDKQSDESKIVYKEFDDIFDEIAQDTGYVYEAYKCIPIHKNCETDTDHTSCTYDSSDSDSDIDNKTYKQKNKKPVEEKNKNKVQKKPANVVKRKRKVKVDKRLRPFENDKELNQSFTFKKLSKEEQIEDFEKRKFNGFYMKCNFKCTLCFKGFEDGDVFEAHKVRHTQKCGDFECDICKLRYQKCRDLSHHKLTNHKERFSCRRCEFVTPNRTAARAHARGHDGGTYACEICGKRFTKPTSYFGHLRIKHPSNHICQLCGFSYTSEKGVLLHQRLKHRLEDLTIPEDGPLCERCNIRFANETALFHHLSVSPKHMDEGARLRNDGNARSKDFVKHKHVNPKHKRASGKWPLPCEQCGIQIESNVAYRHHFRRTHPDKNRTNYPEIEKPCMCEQCGRIFSNTFLLKDHSWVHTGTRPFACEVCGKRYPTRAILYIHRRLHNTSNLKLYPCEICGKQFNRRSNMQVHMTRHQDVRPFACDFCDKTFKNVKDMKSHIAHTHHNKPWPKKKKKTKEKQVAGVTEQLTKTEMDI